jgi:hypothetical protein
MFQNGASSFQFLNNFIDDLISQNVLLATSVYVLTDRSYYTVCEGTNRGEEENDSEHSHIKKARCKRALFIQLDQLQTSAFISASASAFCCAVSVLPHDFKSC